MAGAAVLCLAAGPSQAEDRYLTCVFTCCGFMQGTEISFRIDLTASTEDVVGSQRGPVRAQIAPDTIFFSLGHPVRYAINRMTGGFQATLANGKPGWGTCRRIEKPVF